MNTNNGELVVYSNFNGDITKAVQSTAAIREIRPENRVVVNGGMYVASCTSIELKSSGFLGILSLAFYKEIAKEADNDNRNNLVELVMDKFFKTVKGKPDIVHEGKEYKKTWHSYSRRYASWVILSGDAYSEAIGEMKAELIKDRELLISNDFLLVLFGPVINSLLEVHKTLGRF